MRRRFSAILITALLCLAPTVALCDLAPYSQDFEGLVASGPDDPDQVSLANDGWLVFGNVFGPDWSYWYGYGPFPAPNGGCCGGDAFSAVVVGQGAAEQGDQQLVVFSDYNNGNHGDGSNGIIESNVYQQQVIGAADVGDVWTFEFDAKRGDIEAPSMAAAFFKTIGANFNYYPVDMTNISDAWTRYSLSILITPELEGHLLQFGFLNHASRYEPSGIFYDNVTFAGPLSVDLDLRPGGCPNPINTSMQGDFPAALLGSADFDVNSIDIASLNLEGVAPIRWAYEDVAGPFGGDLCGCTTAGPDGFMDLTIKFDTLDLLNAVDFGQGGSYPMMLIGTLLDGTEFTGQDCVILVGRGTGSDDLEAEASGGDGIQGFGQLPIDNSTSFRSRSTRSTREGVVRKPRDRR